MAKRPRAAKSAAVKPVEDYRHPEAKGARVPDAGAQPFVDSRRPDGQYRYDSSLAPSLQWDEGNPAREEAEALIRAVLDAPDLPAAKAAAAKLKAMSAPFLNWAGKAERPTLDVPTLPLFVHERLTTKGIIETLHGHRRSHTPSLFNDPELSFGEQALQAYEHAAKWSNRMILGDNLRVMNWLLKGENLGGQVQMIYLDPPYGIKYGSNFQPFVRKRDVTHNDDDDLTREPEMVQAYRDTWEIGLHSYLTYLRDRLTLARELLHPSGSVFVQIGDDNVHHVNELLSEVFGAENYVVKLIVQKTGSQTGSFVQPNSDIVLWYTKDKTAAANKFHRLFSPRRTSDGVSGFNLVELADGTSRSITHQEAVNPDLLPSGSRLWRAYPLTSDGYRPATTVSFEFEGKTYHPGPARHWGVSVEDLERVAKAGRIVAQDKQIRFKSYLDDFPVVPLGAIWDDVGGAVNRLYVVQTTTRVVERCILMTTDPGDLVLDPTCGSGTTAYVAEQWGRRWITIDVSRVPLALARQRLLTATFDWYRLRDDDRGPAGGFVYTRKQNRKGEEVGGIVSHVTLKSIANCEPPAEEVLVDRPETNDSIIRVTGPFSFEASIPQAADEHAQPPPASGTFHERLLDALRRSPKIHFDGNQTVEVHDIRRPAKSQHLAAEGELRNGTVSPVGFVFGPENGPVTEKQVLNALREAHAKSIARLLVVGLNIQPAARLTVENAADMGLPPATYLQVTPDLLMGDLLKNMRSSQVFSVCGLPDVVVRSASPQAAKAAKGKKAAPAGPPRWEVELRGLDVFDPVTMQPTHRGGNDVPAWFLDTNYNDKCFYVCQAFFPRTGAWDNLKKELKSGYDEGVWDHLSGTVSAPFEAGDHRQVAVKVVDDRGNELMVVKPLGGGT